MPARNTYAEAVADMLPSQWYSDAKPKDPRFQGPKELMLAVLMDALRCLRGSHRSQGDARHRSLVEAEMWIADRDAQGPFAFETVCESLGLNPERLRETVGEWRQQRLNCKDARSRIRQLPQVHARRMLRSIPRRRES